MSERTSDRLRERLRALGVSDDEIDQAARNGTLLELAVDRILVGQPRYTSDEISEKADIDIETLRRLWRALGFTDTVTKRRVGSS